MIILFFFLFVLPVAFVVILTCVLGQKAAGVILWILLEIFQGCLFYNIAVDSHSAFFGLICIAIFIGLSVWSFRSFFMDDRDDF